MCSIGLKSGLLAGHCSATLHLGTPGQFQRRKILHCHALIKNCCQQDFKMAGDKQLFSSALCKYCSKNVSNGVKCIKCTAYYHPSCAKRVKVKFISEEAVNCCETVEKSCESDENTLDEEANALLTRTLEQNEHLKRENSLLEDLLGSKDEIIRGLREEIHLLNENMRLIKEIKSIKSMENNIFEHISETCIADKNVTKHETKSGGDKAKINKPSQCNSRLNKTDDIVQNVNTQILEEKQREKMNELIRMNEPNTPTTDSDGFQLVQHRSGKKRTSLDQRKYNRNKFGITIGTKSTEQDATFRARPSKMWLYIGKVNEGVGQEVVEKYIKEKCPVSSTNDLIVKQLPTLGRSPSFQVGIDVRYYDKLKLAEFWPSGIVVRRYNFRVNKTRQISEEPSQNFLDIPKTT